MAAPGRHLGTFFGAAAVVAVLDQLTKQWALSALADGPIDLVGSLRLNLVFNDRAAFSLGFGSTTAIALVGCTLVAVLVVMGVRAEQRGWALGLGIILGGALGNLADRAFRAGDGFLGGRVVDMVDLQWWPVFNLADVALWVGVGVLLLTSFRSGEGSPSAADPEPDGT
jgi:signal peptidase II